MPAIKTRRVFETPLIIYEATGEKGDSILMQTLEDLDRNTRIQLTIYVKGEVLVTRKSGVATGAGSYTMKAGDVSYESTLPTIITVGTFESLVVEDCLYYCVMHAEKLALSPTSLRLQAGANQLINKGHWLFLITGTINVRDQEISGPRIVHLATADVNVLAKTDVFGVILTW